MKRAITQGTEIRLLLEEENSANRHMYEKNTELRQKFTFAKRHCNFHAKNV